MFLALLEAATNGALAPAEPNVYSSLAKHGSALQRSAMFLSRHSRQIYVSLRWSEELVLHLHVL
jgi:hypothetical protein